MVASTVETSPGPVLREYAIAELNTAIAGLAWRGGRVHEGVHRARKALRRTRAALALGGDALGPGARLLDRELKRLNDGLSALRDAQAMVETLDRHVAKRRDTETSALLRRARRAAAAERAACAHAALQDDPALGQRRALLAMFRAALAALPWDTVTIDVVNAAAARSAERIATAHERVHATQDDEDWHRWRRRMRRFSQQLRALKAAGLAFEPPALFDKCLAEQLGVAQDLRLLIEHCGRRSALRKRDRIALRHYAEQALAKQRKRIADVERRGDPDAAAP
ncbi:CHAD domain-containing protein [Luteimonas sp. SX5]|uniref:CHAD domain-containing protein n=1 Tax=Luteimonas galliterrae TaxID=2940486 RepID=A0ABT0MKA7_9GAMM|nr:CHAD domain-containing protein [Luteimonas galliterrae]MCL1635078.1 CHAD domain-containing protein [Luteimonas galliterrae]